ncbi:MAG TPA: hypothetical protein VM118_04030 [Acidobacteriota bacterium]|nr:hypothetical protein [Acidobacteriota bacterium]
MSSFVEMIREFGWVVNITVMVGLVGLLVAVYRVLIGAKNAQIDLLRQQLASARDSSIENVSARFRTLKEYYEVQLREWHEASIRELQEEHRKALETRRLSDQTGITREMEERHAAIQAARLSDREVALSSQVSLSINDVCGEYSVVGRNPRAQGKSYRGTLTIRNVDEVLEGVWEVAAGSQRHEGVGIIHGNALAFVFRYKVGDYDAWYYGVVVYEWLTDVIMRGKWTGFGGTHMGFEECRKIR